MNDRNEKRVIHFLFLATILALLQAAMPAVGAAGIEEPGSAEPRPSARRTAARAIERRSSTQWLSDIAERIRILEDQARRAAEAKEAPRSMPAPTAQPDRSAR